MRQGAIHTHSKWSPQDVHMSRTFGGGGIEAAELKRKFLEG